MYGDNNQDNPVAHSLVFRVITGGIRDFASPRSTMQKDRNVLFVKEQLSPSSETSAISPRRGCASACVHQ